MSITTAFAAGYQPGFCEPGCARTTLNPLFDTDGWLPADTTGWLPAMLLPIKDEALAKAVIDRGVRADGSAPRGTAYLVRTQDAARNVRAVGYADAKSVVANRVGLREIATPIQGSVTDVIAYFTGTARVEELHRLTFLPGAVARSFDVGGWRAGGIVPDVGARMAAAGRYRLLWLRIRALQSRRQIPESRGIPGPLPARRQHARGVLEERRNARAGPVHRRTAGAPLLERGR